VSFRRHFFHISALAEPFLASFAGFFLHGKFFNEKNCNPQHFEYHVTLLEINISHLRKKENHLQTCLGKGDMLVPWRVVSFQKKTSLEDLAAAAMT